MQIAAKLVRKKGGSVVGHAASLRTSSRLGPIPLLLGRPEGKRPPSQCVKANDRGAPPPEKTTCPQGKAQRAYGSLWLTPIGFANIKTGRSSLGRLIASFVSWVRGAWGRFTRSSTSSSVVVTY